MVDEVSDDFESYSDLFRAKAAAEDFDDLNHAIAKPLNEPAAEILKIDRRFQDLERICEPINMGLIVYSTALNPYSVQFVAWSPYEAEMSVHSADDRHSSRRVDPSD